MATSSGCGSDSPVLHSHNLLYRLTGLTCLNGKSNSAIAYRLGYSQSTVKQELQRISRRLKAANRNEAVTRAIELNLMTTGNAVPVESDGAGIS
ncbi:MAG: LuxR C-terminal-related transcriptional regulator [Actinomycetia bacterium]|nr:LuxR C-terminal-related transcriptional regulator [Actinomycetes bacterium]